MSNGSLYTCSHLSDPDYFCDLFGCYYHLYVKDWLVIDGGSCLTGSYIAMILFYLSVYHMKICDFFFFFSSVMYCRYIILKRVFLAIMFFFTAVVLIPFPLFCILVPLCPMSCIWACVVHFFSSVWISENEGNCCCQWLISQCISLLIRSISYIHDSLLDTSPHEEFIHPIRLLPVRIYRMMQCNFCHSSEFLSQYIYSCFHLK